MFHAEWKETHIEVGRGRVDKDHDRLLGHGLLEVQNVTTWDPLPPRDLRTITAGQQQSHKG